MMCNNKGFSLIECLLYCAISALLITISMHSFVAIQTHNKKELARIKQSIELANALSLIIRDFEQSTSVVSTREDANICSLPHTDVGWYVHTGWLVRYQGVYNSNTSTWHCCTENKVASHIKHCSIEQKFQSVTCTLTDDTGCTYSQTVALLNGLRL
jgi:type II secretory pathway component PulJ